MTSSSTPRTGGALLTLTLLFTLVLPGGVAAAQYGGTSGLIINPPVILSGDSVDIIGSGCSLGETVSVSIPALGETIATTIATGDDGDFIISDVIVVAERPGVYPVQARCGRLRLHAELTVVDSEAERQARARIIERQRLENGLALTGTGLPTTLAKSATALIAAGCFLAALGRRRDQDEHPEGHPAN